MLFTNILAAIVLFFLLYCSFVLCMHSILSCLEEYHRNATEEQPRTMHDVLLVTVEDKTMTCAICMDPLHSSVTALLPCHHLFHHQCILQWKKPTCPLCRTPSAISSV